MSVRRTAGGIGQSKPIRSQKLAEWVPWKRSRNAEQRAFRNRNDAMMNWRLKRPLTTPTTLVIEKPHTTIKYYRKLCMCHLAVGLLRTGLHHDGSIQVFVQLFAQKLVREVTWSNNKMRWTKITIRVGAIGLDNICTIPTKSRTCRLPYDVGARLKQTVHPIDGGDAINRWWWISLRTNRKNKRLQAGKNTSRYHLFLIKKNSDERRDNIHSWRV